MEGCFWLGLIKMSVEGYRLGEGFRAGFIKMGCGR